PVAGAVHTPDVILWLASEALVGERAPAVIIGWLDAALSLLLLDDLPQQPVEVSHPLVQVAQEVLQIFAVTARHLQRRFEPVDLELDAIQLQSSAHCRVGRETKTLGRLRLLARRFPQPALQFTAVAAQQG